MKKDLKQKEAIFPMPVLMIATYNDDGSVDVMNAAWGTMYDRDIILLNLDEDHQTSKNILSRKAFSVSIADRTHLVEADYLGIVSQKEEKDKFKKSGLSYVPSKHVDAPIINEFPIAIECELMKKTDAGFLGKVINVSCEEVYLDHDQVNMEKVQALSYDPYTFSYYVVSKKVGKAFKDGLKKK